MPPYKQASFLVEINLNYLITMLGLWLALACVHEVYGYPS